MFIGKKGMEAMATKIIMGVVGAVIAFFVLNALLPTFLSSADTLNTTITTSKMTGGSALGSILYLLPFLLIIGVIIVLIVYFLNRQGWG